MKRFFIFAGGAVVVLVLAVAGFFIFLQSKEASYQADAAKKRISDIYEIAQLLEDCKSRQGYYPFVDILRQPPDEGYVTVPLAVMLSQPDQDWVHQRFPFLMSVGKQPGGKLVEELSHCLKQSISLPVDPQHHPYYAPNTYIVLFTEDDSYAVIAFLYEPTPYSSPLAEHVHAMAVSSSLGPVGQQVLDQMRIIPKRFADIPQAEIAQARKEGARMDKMFSRWTTVRIRQ